MSTFKYFLYLYKYFCQLTFYIFFNYPISVPCTASERHGRQQQRGVGLHQHRAPRPLLLHGGAGHQPVLGPHKNIYTIKKYFYFTYILTKIFRAMEAGSRWRNVRRALHRFIHLLPVGTRLRSDIKYHILIYYIIFHITCHIPLLEVGSWANQ